MIDFTSPILNSVSGMLIRSPDQFMDSRFLIVTAALQWQVWALIAVAIVVSGFIFRGLCAILWNRGWELNFPLIECVWIFYAIFVQQG